MTMFLLWRTTACETLRSAGVTPLLRYGLCLTFIRVSSLCWCPLVPLLLRWFTILLFSIFGIDVIAENFYYSDSPGCSIFQFVQLDAVLGPGSSQHRSPKRFAVFCLLPSGRDRQLPPFFPFGATCLIQGYTLHLAILAFGSCIL